MANRVRNVRLELKVTEQEAEQIKKKMSWLKTTNFSVYARKMLLDGYAIRRDFAELKELTHELASLARSINQIARRVNETRSIYAEDVHDLQRYYANMKRACTERLVKMIDEDANAIHVRSDIRRGIHLIKMDEETEEEGNGIHKNPSN